MLIPSLLLLCLCSFQLAQLLLPPLWNRRDSRCFSFLQLLPGFTFTWVRVRYQHQIERQRKEGLFSCGCGHPCLCLSGRDRSWVHLPRICQWGCYFNCHFSICKWRSCISWSVNPTKSWRSHPMKTAAYAVVNACAILLRNKGLDGALIMQAYLWARLKILLGSATQVSSGVLLGVFSVLLQRSPDRQTLKKLEAQ